MSYLRALRFLVPALVAALVLTVPAAHGARIDDYAKYDPQSTCASSVLPGTSFLIRWLMRKYPGTGNASTLRACTSGTSEHKDGRALDWAVDAADPVQRAQAYAFLDRIFATDRRGNTHALARRMGIMYLIWDDHIWSAYGSPAFVKRDYVHYACDSLRNCSKTLRHRDHVHISLSRSGAAAQTTFYRARNVPSLPVHEPGTNVLDPASTAIAKVVVPTDGSVVKTPFRVRRGTTLRIVADGLFRYGAGSRIADGACRWSDHLGDWVPTTIGLRVNGESPWDSPCEGRHTHVASYTSSTTDVLRLRVGDPRPRNNEGTLSFYLLREDVRLREVASRPERAEPAPDGTEPTPAPRRLRREAVTVPAAATAGVYTDRGLRKGRRYRVVVTGEARNDGRLFDGECVRYARRFRPQHTLDLTEPTADHLSLYIQGRRVNLRVPQSTRPCDRSTHRYVGRFRAPIGGKARVQIWDPYSYADNSGTLRIKLRRI